jgi:hypothetical protein
MRRTSSKLNMLKSFDVVNNSIEKLIFNVIFGFFGILALVYILLLGNMVKNIIERQNLETQARSFSNEVRTLESTYLSLSKNVDLNLAYSMGFKETKATFVTRKALGFNSSIDNIKVAQNDL